MEFSPGNRLKDYVQCYFICETDTALVTEDRVFASGCVEIMFNLGTDGPEQLVNCAASHEPAVQLWGQTIRPLIFTSFRKHTMLGVRFFPHTAACFFDEPISIFNDQILDFNEIAGTPARLLYDRLLCFNSIKERLELVEQFLLTRLLTFEHRFGRIKMVGSILKDIGQNDFLENINSFAARYGLSSRYLQKIFIAYSGLGPNLFSKIARFQKSLHLVTQKDVSLTTIAYQCGYFDQSHFIKDFKFFTGTAPSHFQPESSTDLFVPLMN